MSEFVTQYDEENKELIGLPMLLSNFVRVTSDATENSLPEGWYFYNKAQSQPRIEPPSVYHSFEIQTLIEGNTITETWVAVEKTAEEKLAQQNKIKDLWATKPDLEDFSTWVFNEDACTFLPPVACPSDGLMYGENKPGIDKKYWWDNTNEEWVVVTDELKAELDAK